MYILFNTYVCVRTCVCRLHTHACMYVYTYACTYVRMYAHTVNAHTVNDKILVRLTLGRFT